MARTLSRTATVFAAILIGVVCCAVDLGAAGSLDRQYAPGNGPAKGETFAVGHPKNPETWFILAEWLSEQAKDATLPLDAGRTLVLRALEVNDQALALNPDYYRALNLKAALLRQRATSEKDSSVRKRLIAEADGYSVKAAEIAKRRRVPQSVDRPSEPDFSGQWVLVESTGAKAAVATELNVRQPVNTKNVYGAPIPPGYLDLAVDRTLPTGPQSDRYRLGTVSGTVSLPGPVTTRQSVTWAGDTLVITSSQPTGTRIEEWQFNPQGQLVVTLTDEFEKRVPVASATYRKR